MTVRFALGMALFLASAFSGCAAKNGGLADAEVEDAPTVLPARELDWSLTSCYFAAAVFEVPASKVQPYLPEGFRVMPASEFALEAGTGQGVPTPPSTSNDGNIGVEAFQCDEGSGVNGTVPGMVYSSFYAGVEPPASLKRAGIPFYFVKWDTLIPDQERRELLAAYGAPVHNGTAAVSLGMAQGSLAEVSGGLSFGAFGNFSFEATALSPFPADRCGFIEFTAVPGGFIEWETRCTFLHGGVGPVTVNVPAGSWFANVLGAGSHDGLGFVGHISFGPGTIRLPETQAVPAAAPV